MKNYFLYLLIQFWWFKSTCLRFFALNDSDGTDMELINEANSLRRKIYEITK